MDTEIILAVISGSIAIIVSFIACCQQYKISKDSMKNEKIKDRNVRKLENNKLLQKYKDPLLQASRELFINIENIFKIKSNFLKTDIDKKTLIYCFVQFLCWVEIIRKNLIIMDDINSSKFFNLREKLQVIQNSFDNNFVEDNKFRINLAEQKAIGELITQDNTCISYTNFISKYDDFHPWLEKLEQYIDELSNNIESYSPSLPDYEKPNRFYNDFEIYCKNLFDDHEWVLKNYFDKPHETKCLRCNQGIGEYYHPTIDISVNYIRLLNIKNAINKLIYARENNNEYSIDINPIWNKKISKVIEKNGIKEKYKLDYGNIWWLYYYFYSSNYFQETNYNNINQDSDSYTPNQESNGIGESEFIEDTFEEIIDFISN
jgi:hypothetical protein